MGEDLKPRGDFKPRRPILPWLFCAFGVTTAVAAFLLLWHPRWKPDEQTLSDGTILTVAAVTFGTNHSFSTHPIREKVRNLLPKRLQPFLGKGNFSHRISTPHDALVLWIVRFDPVSNTYVRWQNEQHYSADEHGCRFRSNYRSGATLAGKSISGVAFDAFPRTAKHFNYVICDSSGKALGELRVANLFRAGSERWIPEKTPVTKTNDGLVVELQDLSRWHPSTRSLPISILGAHNYNADNADLWWEKGAVWLYDSSGNRTLFGHLCTNEPAWKIEANFFRKARAEFRPDEIWVITNVAIPKPAEVVLLHKTNTLQGCVVAVASLEGAGYVGQRQDVRRVPPETRLSSIPPPPPRLLIWSGHWKDEIRILIRAKDDSGRTLVTRAHDRLMGYSFRATQLQEEFDIHPLPDSRSIDIEVLVQKPTKFEFLVVPSQAIVSD